jgi:hypothetical protein
MNQGYTEILNNSLSATLSSDVLQDDIALAIARAIAAANKRARELNIDVMLSHHQPDAASSERSLGMAS